MLYYTGVLPTRVRAAPAASGSCTLIAGSNSLHRALPWVIRELRSSQ
jgi:hypothetical protein